ncbi:MAG: glycosyltransferase involved in cell wall biosynthesis [Rhodothermales bacterium]|jgi:glycosyltransferase involved in cell wall biosynthesis
MICHYVTGFPTNDQRTANGVHKAVRGLAGGLHQLGTQTEIITDGGVRCSWVTPDGVDVHAFRERGLVPGVLMPAEMRTHIDSLPERTLFVVHGQFSPRMTRVTAALRAMGRPYVVMPHTLFSDAVFAKNRIVKFVYWHLLEKPMLKKASLIQILEREQAQPLRQRGVSTPAAVVPNAIDLAATIPESELSWSTTGPIRLYYLGRINFHQKALDILVKAVAQVRKEFDIHLTIQGPDAGDLETLKGIARNTGADEALTILPPNFAKSATKLIAGHDVFCMPSRIEGFPMAALEAMQAGRPLLCTNVSGLTKTIQKSGCGELVSPTVGDVVRGLKTLCARRDEFEAMGRSGRDYAINQFSPIASARIAKAAYGQIMPGSQGRARVWPHPLVSPENRPAVEPRGVQSTGVGQGQTTP